MATTDTYPDLQRWREPPIMRMLSTGTLLHGNHTNKVWRSLVQTMNNLEPGMPVMVKFTSKKPVIAAELACALAARALRLQVPNGVLVLAEKDQLPELPRSVTGGSKDLVICYGSELQFPDDTVARPTSAAGAEEWTWANVCNTAQGPMGAAWDELVANADRHCDNLVFDGARWWLIDHEYTMPSVAKTMKRFAETQVRQQLIDETAKENTLAVEVLRRRPNDHKMDTLPKNWQPLRSRLEWLADRAQEWHTPMAEVNSVLEMTHLYLRSIHLRLPALALHLANRMQQPQGASLWNSYTSTASPTPRKTTRHRPA